MSQRRPHSARRQSGLTLIEVLVSILIFSFGLLGFVGLQARAIQYSTGAEDSNRAALLANEMAATMVAKGTIDPSSATLATDITTWQGRASAPSVGLPNGQASAVLAGNTTTLTITWHPTNSPSTAPDSKYVTQVLLP